MSIDPNGINTRGINNINALDSYLIEFQSGTPVDLTVSPEEQTQLVNDAGRGFFNWVWVAQTVKNGPCGKLEVVIYQMDKVAQKLLKESPSQENVLTLARYTKFLYDETKQIELTPSERKQFEIDGTLPAHIRRMKQSVCNIADSFIRLDKEVTKLDENSWLYLVREAISEKPHLMGTPDAHVTPIASEEESISASSVRRQTAPQKSAEDLSINWVEMN